MMGEGSTASLPLRPCGKLRLLIADAASEQPLVLEDPHKLIVCTPGRVQG